MHAETYAAIIAAIVSLVVISISAYVSRLTIKAARKTLETQQLGSMTAKLYDVRIESYPKGMEITEALRKTQLDGDVTLNADYLTILFQNLMLGIHPRLVLCFHATLRSVFPNFIEQSERGHRRMACICLNKSTEW